MSQAKYYDGSGNEITQEEHQRILINEQRIAVNEARLNAEKEKISLEFSRYKQDCRKKALDLASRDGNTGSDLIMEEADKYYQWLISIPQ